MTTAVMPSTLDLDAFNWRTYALCAEVDLDLFVLETGQSPRAGLKVCDRCPVRTQCRDDTLALPPSRRRSIVAGGWHFPSQANRPLAPHPDDVALYERLKSEGKI